MVCKLAVAHAGQDVYCSVTLLKSKVVYVLVIAWAEDIMAISSPRPRAQPEDKDYTYGHNIQGNML